MDSIARKLAQRRRFACWPYILAGIFFPVISFPLVLASLMRELRDHIDRRLEAMSRDPARFGAPFGQELARGLAGCRGRLRNPMASVLLLFYVFFPSLIVFQLAAVPRMVPQFSSRRIRNAIFEAQTFWYEEAPVSAAHYSTVPRPFRTGVLYRPERILTDEEAGRSAAPVTFGEVYPWGWGTSAPVMLLVRAKRGSVLPYEVQFEDALGRWHLARAHRVHFRWSGTMVLGYVLYWVFIPAPILTGMILCCMFWMRFARHRSLEVVAAAYANGALRVVDADLPLLGHDNSVLLRATGISALMQGLILPFYGPLVLDRHLLWEAIHSVEEAIGEGAPAAALPACAVGEDAEWRAALDRITQEPSTGLCAMLGMWLPAVSLPVTMAILGRSLRCHIEGRLELVERSEGMSDGSFRPPARRMLRQECGGSLGRVAHLLFFALVAGGIIYPFAAAATVPRQEFHRALEAIMKGGEAPGLWPVVDESDYESMPRHRVVGVHYAVQGRIPAGQPAPPGLPLIDLPSERVARWGLYGECPYWPPSARPPPFEGVARSNGALHRVRLVAVTYDGFGTSTLGAVFYLWLLPSAYVVGAIVHLMFWVRFARHRMAEALAFQAAGGEGAEEIVKEVRARNRWLIVRMGVLQGILGLWAVTVPFAGPWALNNHFEWEQGIGLDEALATHRRRMPNRGAAETAEGV